MKVRLSFDIEVPSHTPVAVLRAAGHSAVCSAENTIEHALENGPRPHGAPGGVCRITIRANEGELT